jgi:hypothetical protein
MRTMIFLRRMGARRTNKRNSSCSARYYEQVRSSFHTASAQAAVAAIDPTRKLSGDKLPLTPVGSRERNSHPQHRRVLVPIVEEKLTGTVQDTLEASALVSGLGEAPARR